VIRVVGKDYKNNKKGTFVHWNIYSAQSMGISEFRAQPWLLHLSVWLAIMWVNLQAATFIVGPTPGKCSRFGIGDFTAMQMRVRMHCRWFFSMASEFNGTKFLLFGKFSLNCPRKSTPEWNWATKDRTQSDIRSFPPLIQFLWHCHRQRGSRWITKCIIALGVWHADISDLVQSTNWMPRCVH